MKKYAEGSMVFPDDIDQPSRTIITSATTLLALLAIYLFKEVSSED